MTESRRRVRQRRTATRSSQVLITALFGFLFLAYWLESIVRI